MPQVHRQTLTPSIRFNTTPSKRRKTGAACWASVKRRVRRHDECRLLQEPRSRVGSPRDAEERSTEDE